MRKKCMLIILLLLTIGQFYSGKAQAAKVKAGFFPLAHFYEFNSEYDASGYGADYLKALAMQGGWDYQWVYYPDWEAALAGLDKGEIDVLAPAQRTSSREQKYDYMPFPIGFELGALFGRSKDYALDYMDMSALQGKTVGCTEDLIFQHTFERFLKNHDTTVNFVYYKNSKDLLEALRNGKEDIILDSLMVKNDDVKILAEFGAAPIYFLVNKQKKDVLEMMGQSAMELNLQQPEFQSELALTYFKDLSAKPFTKKEKEFISGLAPVRVGLAANNFPSSVYDTKTAEFSGIDAEILKLISAVSGLKFELVPLDSKVMNLQTLMDKKLDLIVDVDSSLALSAKRLHFSDPYLTISKVFVAHKGFHTQDKEIVKLGTIDGDDQRLAQLRSEFPDFDLYNYATVDEAMQALHNNQIDLVIRSRRSLGNYLQSPRNSDLEILSLTPKPAMVSYAQVIKPQSSDSLLIPIINTAIQQIGAQRLAKLQMDELYKDRYYLTAGDVFYVYKYPLILAVLLIMVTAYARIYSYRIKQKNLQLIAANEEKLRNITNNINGGVIVFKGESSMEITFANDGFWHLMGFSDEDRAKRIINYDNFVHPEDMPKLHKLMKNIKPNQRESIELKIRRKDGTYVQTLFNGTMAYNAKGDKEFYCVIVDMSEQAALTQKLRVENTKTNMIFDKADEIIYDINFFSKTVQVSQSMVGKLGWVLPKQLSKDINLEEIIEMWHVYADDKKDMEEFVHRVIEFKKDEICTIRLCRADNTYIWCEITAYPTLTEQGEILSIVGMIKDVDKEVKEQKRLKRNASTDALTGLYNKAGFEQAVKDYLAGNQSPDGVLVFMDLDHFKEINDTMGHLMGDQVLQETAQILRKHFVQVDYLGRFGGDEFCVLLKSIPEATLQDRLFWLLKKLKRTFSQGGKQVSISGSIGYARIKDVGTDYKALLDAADKALYQAKDKGRDQFAAYKP